LFVASANYLATLSVAAGAAAESVAVLSLTTESAESADTLSDCTGASALLPQEAKEIAARATNMKTNFFIVFVSLE